MKEIALHILDIAENGIRAGAGSIRISVIEKGTPAFLKILIEDDPCTPKGDDSLFVDSLHL